MIEYNSLSEEGKKLLKKIIIRQLKENGIYSRVKRDFFSKNFIGLDYYFFSLHADDDIFETCIDTFWKMICRPGVSTNIKASIFLMSIFCDERIFDVVNKNKENFIFSRDSIKMNVKILFETEMEYITNTANITENGDEEDRKRLKQLLSKYKELYNFDSNYHKLQYL
jgi:hypothetical protein